MIASDSNGDTDKMMILVIQAGAELGQAQLKLSFILFDLLGWK